jgi:hypothetical protein
VFASECSSISLTLCCTSLFTLLLCALLGLVLFEASLPKAVRRLSHLLVHNRSKRNAVIFFTFLVMALATSVSVVRRRRSELWRNFTAERELGEDEKRKLGDLRSAGRRSGGKSALRRKSARSTRSGASL